MRFVNLHIRVDNKTFYYVVGFPMLKCLSYNSITSQSDDRGSIPWLALKKCLPSRRIDVGLYNTPSRIRVNVLEGGRGCAETVERVQGVGDKIQLWKYENATVSILCEPPAAL